MSILHGSLVMRKIKYRTMLLLAGLNLWLNQIGDILFEYLKKGIDVKNTAENAYVETKNWFTNSWLYEKVTGETVTEEVSSLDPYTILYYVLVGVSAFFWLQIAYALLFAFKDYYNRDEISRKKNKAYLYAFILCINIAVYVYLNIQIYNIYT